jgi:hypothetical protein
MTATMSCGGKRAGSLELLTAHAAIEFHAADGRQIVAVFREKEAVEKRLHRFFGRRLARAHHAIDRNLSRELIGGLVDTQRRGDVRPLVEVVVYIVWMRSTPASRSFASTYP